MLAHSLEKTSVLLSCVEELVSFAAIVLFVAAIAVWSNVMVLM